MPGTRFVDRNALRKSTGAECSLLIQLSAQNATHVYGRRTKPPLFPRRDRRLTAHVLPPVFPRVYKQRTLFFIIIEERWGVLVLEPIQVDLTQTDGMLRDL